MEQKQKLHFKDSQSEWNLPKIQFAPLSVSWERRLQTLGLVYYASILPFTQLFFYLCIWKLCPYVLLVAYGLFVYFDTAPENGSRCLEWYRNFPAWKWLSNYFPVKFINEGELDPNQNYIIGYHPHGVICYGAFICFGTEAANFSKVFPGVKSFIATLKVMFLLPFYRDFVLALNFISCSKKSICNLFSKGPGHAVVIVVGGAEEAMFTHPNTCKLVLKKRLGFVKIAIQQGAHLVPCYCFGENECYNIYMPKPGTFLYSVQYNLKRWTGFTIPFYYGRTPFTYNYGTMPKRVPLTVITGKPITVIQDPNPSTETIERIHREYVDALTDLYNRHKDAYVSKPVPELEFIG